MFTIVPSLYLVSLELVRRWKTPSMNPQESSTISSHLNQSISIDLDETISNIDRTDLSATPTVTTDDDSHRSSMKKANGDQDRSTRSGKTRKKKSNRLSPVYRMERRRTFTEDLFDDDVTYLLLRTTFTREQIDAWHREFLVSGSIKHCE